MTGLGILAQAAVDPGVAASLARIRAEGKTQVAFTPPPQEPPPPEWLVDLIRWLAGGGNAWVTGLAYLLVGLLLLLILYLAVPSVRELVDRWLRRARRVEDGEARGWQPDAAASRDLLSEADALAAAGRYAEAAHLVLGRSIEDLARHRPGLLAPAQTARTIAAADALPDAARSALRGIVDAVERGHWAQRLLDLADWQAVRAAYERFAFGPHWRGASL